MTDLAFYIGKHREPSGHHCCFSGCFTRPCGNCGEGVCIRNFHYCGPRDYVGRHRR